MFVDSKGYPYTIQKSEYIEVVFQNGVFNVPQNFLGGFISVEGPGDIKWNPLHQETTSYITENFPAGDSICRPRKILESNTTATGIKIWK